MVMMFAPHRLLVLRASAKERDALGRTTRPATEEWEDVGECRCDDSGVSEVTSANGEVFRPSAHIVCGGSVRVAAGDKVRVLWKRDGSVRMEGVARNVTGCNLLDYKSVYL